MQAAGSVLVVAEGGRSSSLATVFFLTAVRRRRGTDLRMLGDLYHVHTATMSCIVQTMVNYMGLQLSIISILPDPEKGCC